MVMPRWRLSLLLAPLLALMVLVPTVASARQAPETIGIRLVDAPTSRQRDPRAQQYIVDHLAPGTTIKRRVEVSNDTSKPASIDLYAGAAEIAEGSFRFGEGRGGNDLTSWTRVDPSTVTLAPDAKAQATVTIAVPKDASEGERYGVVWAELPSAVPEGGGIATVNRVGVRMYLSVGSGAEPAAEFVVDNVQARRQPDGTPAVTARVRNTGGRALDLSGELRLSDGPAGLAAGPFPVQLGSTLGVRQSEALEVGLDQAIRGGPWTARLTLRSGSVTRSTEARITFPTTPGESAPAERRPPQQSLALRLLLGAIMLAVFFGLALLLFLGVRRRRQDDGSA